MIPSLCYARILLLARFSVERKAPRYFFCLLSLNFYGHFSVGECLLHCQTGGGFLTGSALINFSPIAKWP